MTDIPPRRFWRFHLSTAVLLTLMAGLLLWANMRHLPASITELDQGTQVKIANNGWPLHEESSFLIKKPFAGGTGVYVVSGDKGMQIFDYGESKPPLHQFIETMSPPLSPTDLALNVLSGLSILFMVAVVAEGIVQRREIREP